jgi:N-alpha-acetyltransferase 38, NatC auxiliary subunit
MDKVEAREFLTSLLNKNLRVVTTDGRMFWGQFKCTDTVWSLKPGKKLQFCRILLTFFSFRKQDQNVILAHTYEYRQPSIKARMEAAQSAAGTDKVLVDMTSRHLGLVVVPGKYIVKIEVEEFASQMKGQVAA